MGKKTSILDKLKQRLRFIIQDEQSLEEISSSNLSRFQLITRVLSVFLLIAVATSALIAFSPLREFIPGYSPPELSKNLVHLSIKADSLLAELQIQEQKFLAIDRVLKGEPLEDSAIVDTSFNLSVSQDALIASQKDSLFRDKVEREDRFNILNDGVKKPTELKDIVFYTPLKGMISDAFDRSAEHYGVDIVAPKNEAIKSCLSGTVVFSGWTSETGYTIAIQHSNDLISIYKHNSVLLKQIGELVLSGDVIAIIGNSGELSTGPHLHFELWHKGQAINPEQHILF